MSKETPRQFPLKRPAPYLLFLLLALAFFYQFVFWGYHYISADFLDWYYPWRHNLLKDNAENTYISNRTLGDPVFMFAPIDKTYNEEIKKGRLYLWNDNNFLGHPVYASHTAAFFYPPKIAAHYFFDPLSAREVLGIFHLFLMASLMYNYLKNIGLSKFSASIGGILWMLNGFVVTRIQFGIDIYPLAYLPLMLWMIDSYTKKGGGIYPLFFALGSGLCLLSGHWQFVFYCFLFSAIYALFRLIQEYIYKKTIPIKKALLLIGTAIWGFCISALQSFPVLQLAELSRRPVYDSMKEMFSRSALLPENLFTLILPELFGSPINHIYFTRINSGTQNYFELMIYMGILPLFFACISIWSSSHKKTALFFVISAGVILLMAMGTPLYGILFYSAAFIRGFTPVRILCLFAFSMASAAAIGIDAFEEKRKSMEYPPWVFLSLLGISALVLAFVIYNVQGETPLFARTVESYWKLGIMTLPNNYADTGLFVKQMLLRVKDFYKWDNFSLIMPIIIGAAGVFVLIMRRKEKLSKAVFAAAVLFLIIIDLFPIGQRFNKAFPPEAVYPPSTAVSYIKQIQGSGRIAGIYRYPHPNTLTAYGIREINGYYSMYPSRIRELFFAINGGSLPAPLLVVLQEGVNLNPGLSQLMNISYFYSSPGAFIPPVPSREIYRKDLSIFESGVKGERVFLTDNYKVVSSEDSLSALLSHNYNPFTQVLLEDPLPKEFQWARRGELLSKEDWKADIIDYHREKITLQVQTSNNSFLVYSGTYYPGWKARINGEPAPVLRANFFAFAVPVEAGVHEIELYFSPDILKQGALLSALSFFIWAASLIFVCSRQSK